MLACSPVVLSAGGILIRKPYANAQDEKLFKAQPYQSLEVVGGNAYSLDLPDQPPVRLSSAMVADSIPLPEPGVLDQITSEADITEVKTELSRLQQAAQRWPVAAPHLQAAMAQLQTAVQNFEKGLVKMGGQWIEQGEMEAITLRSGESITFQSINAEGLELTADTASGIRRLGFFDMLPEDQKKYFPDFAELVAEAEAGDMEAAETVAMRLYTADTGRDRFTQAARFFEQLAGEGDEVARYRLALMNQSGMGIDRNLSRARDLYRQGAEAGFGPALMSHGFALHYGFGQEPAPARALDAFIKAGEQGDPLGTYFAALFTGQGLGVEADEEQAVALLQEASGKEEPWALNEVALCRMTGAVLERDEEAALADLKLSAALGSPAGETNYGVALLEADAEGNAEMAAKLFQIAASKGYPPAQFNLGLMLKTGTGISQDPAGAQNYLRLARQGGVADAEDALNDLEDGSTDLRVSDLQQEKKPMWEQEGVHPLEYRLTLIRKRIEQPWLPGGDWQAELRKLEARAQAAAAAEESQPAPEAGAADPAQPAEAADQPEEAETPAAPETESAPAE
jgi:TPR repeat protein